MGFSWRWHSPPRVLQLICQLQRPQSLQLLLLLKPLLLLPRNHQLLLQQNHQLLLQQPRRQPSHQPSHQPSRQLNHLNLAHATFASKHGKVKEELAEETFGISLPASPRLSISSSSVGSKNALFPPKHVLQDHCQTLMMMMMISHSTSTLMMSLPPPPLKRQQPLPLKHQLPLPLNHPSLAHVTFASIH